jgi:mannose-6-phosphate isomerase-like protein (cupin superfamily)
MNKIFKIGGGFKVPDGTIVHSILDPQLLKREGPKMVGDLSLALGEIPPKTVSKIHIHPIVSQLTWVVSGNLKVKMKDHSMDKPYSLELKSEEAAFTEAGTFFQLINEDSETCRVLYIVSPAFLFELDKEGRVLYNDAVVFDEGWKDLPKINNLNKVRDLRSRAWYQLLQK